MPWSISMDSECKVNAWQLVTISHMQTWTIKVSEMQKVHVILQHPVSRSRRSKGLSTHGLTLDSFDNNTCRLNCYAVLLKLHLTNPRRTWCFWQKVALQWLESWLWSATAGRKYPLQGSALSIHYLWPRSAALVLKVFNMAARTAVTPLPSNQEYFPHTPSKETIPWIFTSAITTRSQTLISATLTDKCSINPKLQGLYLQYTERPLSARLCPMNRQMIWVRCLYFLRHNA
jgi:hypothetical protein